MQFLVLGKGKTGSLVAEVARERGHSVRALDVDENPRTFPVGGDHHVIFPTIEGGHHAGQSSGSEAGVGIHAHAPGQNVSGNVIVGNWVSGNGIDPDSGSGHPTGIALFSAVVPVTVTVANNHVSHEFWGIFRAGPLTINGLPSNHYSSSVTTPVN